MAVVADIDNVLFDLDGTLVDSRETIATSIVHALEKMDVDAATGPRVETLIGMPLYDIFVGRFGMEEVNALQAIDYYRVYYDNLNQAGTRVYERVHEDLARLQAEGYRLYIATVKPTQIAEKVLSDMDLLPFFEGVAGASMGPERRDKSSIIAHALSKFGLAPSRSMMVGDRDQDVEGARANGLRSVGVTYGFGMRDEILGSSPDFVADNSGEISRLLSG